MRAVLKRSSQASRGWGLGRAPQAPQAGLKEWQNGNESVGRGGALAPELAGVLIIRDVLALPGKPPIRNFSPECWTVLRVSEIQRLV